MTQLSIVVPVYECESCLRELHRRVSAAVGTITDDYELVLVEDRGSDQSWSVILELARVDPAVKGYRLSRNFGQHAAITAGLAQASGDWIVVMDCDLQEPPEEIPRLFARAQEGFDIVFARRKNPPSSPWYRFSRWLWYRAFYTFTRNPVDATYASLSLFSRRVAEAYLKLRDRSREHILMLTWLGFDSTWIEFEQHERFAGRSSYGFGTLLRLSFDQLFFQTTVLLRWVVYVGFAFAAAGLGLAGYYVAAKIFGDAAPGFTSLAVFTLTIGGLTIMSVGVIGLYIGKVFEQVKERPIFVVDRTTQEELATTGQQHGLRR
jgi:glycosyltransferase involved in cell wall biosynthesis